MRIYLIAGALIAGGIASAPSPVHASGPCSVWRCAFNGPLLDGFVQDDGAAKTATRPVADTVSTTDGALVAVVPAKARHIETAHPR